MDLIKAIIIDDEWLIRSEINRLLSKYPEIDVVGEAVHLSDAIELIEQFNPDVIFLDIELSGEIGFDLLDKTELNCEIIFVTAYNQYAVRAFEVNALDYLLKPIQPERFAKTIQRLLKHEPLKPQTIEKVKNDDVVYVMVNGSLKFLKISELRCIIARGNYTDIVYEECKKDLVSKSLNEWETILPEKYFLRIHRSTIINFKYVDKIEKLPNQTQLVFIKGMDRPLAMSRRYATKLKKLLVW
jgi:two-component system LytT family response regulator